MSFIRINNPTFILIKGSDQQNMQFERLDTIYQVLWKFVPDTWCIKKPNDALCVKCKDLRAGVNEPQLSDRLVRNAII